MQTGSARSAGRCWNGTSATPCRTSPGANDPPEPDTYRLEGLNARRVMDVVRIGYIDATTEDASIASFAEMRISTFASCFSSSSDMALIRLGSCSAAAPARCRLRTQAPTTRGVRVGDRQDQRATAAAVSPLPVDDGLQLRGDWTLRSLSTSWSIDAFPERGRAGRRRSALQTATGPSRLGRLGWPGPDATVLPGSAARLGAGGFHRGGAAQLAFGRGM